MGTGPGEPQADCPRYGGGQRPGMATWWQEAGPKAGRSEADFKRAGAKHLHRGPHWSLVGKLMHRLFSPFRITLLLLAAALPCAGQPIVLSTSSVIGGGPIYDSPAFTGGSFPATFVVNEQTGAINNDVFGGNYWLGPDSVNSDYFVLDLGALYSLTQITLFNTHNANFNDRATSAFHITASNAVSFVDANHGFALDSPTTILSGTLTLPTDPPPGIVFTSGNGLSTDGFYRDISFTYDSFAGGAGGGLHEIRVEGAVVPEPATSALWAGAATLAVLAYVRINGMVPPAPVRGGGQRGGQGRGGPGAAPAPAPAAP